MIKVYIAARGEDQRLAGECRAQLALHGLFSTATWIDLPFNGDTHDLAQMCVDDVRLADALIVIKPKDSHRETTGGHHVETGIALERGMPIVLLGEPENLFHAHEIVRVIAWPVPSWLALANYITLKVEEHRGLLALRAAEVQP